MIAMESARESEDRFNFSLLGCRGAIERKASLLIQTLGSEELQALRSNRQMDDSLVQTLQQNHTSR